MPPKPAHESGPVQAFTVRLSPDHWSKVDRLRRPKETRSAMIARLLDRVNG